MRTMISAGCRAPGSDRLSECEVCPRPGLASAAWSSFIFFYILMKKDLILELF